MRHILVKTRVFISKLHPSIFFRKVNMNENCSQYFYDYECFNNESYCIFFHELCKNIPFCNNKCKVEHLIIRAETLYKMNENLTTQNNSLMQKIVKAKEVLI